MTAPAGFRNYHPIVREGIAKLDVAAGLALSAVAVFQVGGGDPHNAKRAGAGAAALVLLMTLPVIWRRPAPVRVAAVLAIGAILNIAVIGDMVRCAAALPALLLCAYAAGRYPARLRWPAAALGLSFLLVSATAQAFTDPALTTGPPFGAWKVVDSALILAFFVAGGALVESRTRLGVELRRRNEELRRQRQHRAELAVAADRTQIAGSLQDQLEAHIGEMRDAAVTGRRALTEEGSPRTAAEAFGAIHRRGRETLTQMRRVVGTLLENLPPEPQPSLSQLDSLLERAGPADVHLHVSGRPRILPPGVEVAAYRILEHLLEAFGAGAGQRIDVAVDFAAEALKLTVRGPASEPTDIQSALASIRARVDLHNGSMTSTRPDGLWATNITLPLQADA